MLNDSPQSTQTLINRMLKARTANALHCEELARNIGKSEKLITKCRGLMKRFVKSQTQPRARSVRFASNKKRPQKTRAIKRKVDRVEQLLARSSTSHPSTLNGMHQKHVVGAKLLAFPPGGRDYRRPILLGNPTPLAPLLGLPMTDANVGRHVRNSLPTIEQFTDGLHSPNIPLDSVSSKGATNGPVTFYAHTRTMCPMGKATTPATFKRDFCKRLAAARVMAGFEQAEFAMLLGVLPNTYSKYERRSLLPHHLVEKAGQILNVDANYLFTGAISKVRQYEPLPQSRESA